MCRVVPVPVLLFCIDVNPLPQRMYQLRAALDTLTMFLSRTRQDTSALGVSKQLTALEMMGIAYASLSCYQVRVVWVGVWCGHHA